MALEISEDVVSLAYQNLGYFVVEGLKLPRNREIDLLAVRLDQNGEVNDRVHVEVKISVKPAGVLRGESELGDSGKRPVESAREFVAKKFDAPAIKEAAERVLGSPDYRRVMIHGKLKKPSQIDVLREEGVECLSIGELVSKAIAEGRQNRLHRAVGIALLLTDAS